MRRKQHEVTQKLTVAHQWGAGCLPSNAMLSLSILRVLLCMAEKKHDVYASVTNRIIADLERGELTWMKPWQTSAPASPIRANGEPYRGVNILMLWFAAMEKGFGSPYWMTYKQAQELGAQVRQGEKGSHVVYANTFTKSELDNNGEEVETQIPFLKTYSVFNADQIDGLPERFLASSPLPSPQQRISHAEQFFKTLTLNLHHGGERAFYRRTTDSVHMPDFERFFDALGYYGTLAHEVTHWTGHESRLNREFGQRFGDAAYAMEELVAELGAAFLCADLNLTPEPREETAAYIASWLTTLKADKHAVFAAASQAQKAADFLHRKRAHAISQAEESLAQLANQQLQQGRLELLW